MTRIQLADDETFDFTASQCGYGIVIVSDGGAPAVVVAAAKFFFDETSTITMEDYSAGSIAFADTDGYFCIYNNAGAVRLKNRLGGNRVVGYQVGYFDGTWV